MSAGLVPDQSPGTNMNRAERRRLEREQSEQDKVNNASATMNPLERWQTERESYISGLAQDALHRTAGPESISLQEAIDAASKGEGTFWSFLPERRGSEVYGGTLIFVEHYEDEENLAPEDQWTISTESGRFDREEFGEEGDFGPGDDLSEFEVVRFVPIADRPHGMMLPFALAELLGRPEQEIDQYL